MHYPNKEIRENGLFSFRVFIYRSYLKRPIFLVNACIMPMIFVFSGVFSFNPVHGQQMCLDQPPWLDTYPFFNTDFMKAHHIQSIALEVMYKAPNKRIMFSAEKMEFAFNSTGGVSQWSQINRSGTERRTSFFLNKLGQLATSHVVAPKIDHLKSYVYNDSGLVTEIQLADAQTAQVIWSDKYKYEHFSAFQYKRYNLNDEGLTFKYMVVDLNETGMVVETRTRFIRGGKTESTFYNYQDGLLMRYIHNVKEEFRREVKYVMHYDNRVIIEMDKYEDGAWVAHIEYLYGNELLTAILTKNMKTEVIKIQKLKYVFYPLMPVVEK